MNCTEARQLTALYAGGDLPECDRIGLERHLASCPACSAVLEEHRRIQTLIAATAEADGAVILRDTFTDTVMGSIDASHGKSTSANTRAKWIRFTVRLAAAALVVYLGTSVILNTRHHHLITAQREAIDAEASRPRSYINLTANEKILKKIDGPHPAATWKPETVPGVYVVMHKPDPEGSPDTYSVDYITQSDGVTVAEIPWLTYRRHKMLTRAGSIDNIYIAVIPLPDSSKRERTTLASILERKFKPFINRGA